MTGAAEACLILWLYAMPVDGPLSTVIETRVILRGPSVAVERRVVAEHMSQGEVIAPMRTEWTIAASARLTRGGEYTWLELKEGDAWTSWNSPLTLCGNGTSQPNDPADPTEAFGGP